MNFFKNLFTPKSKDTRTLAELLGPLEKNNDYKGWYDSQPIPIPYFKGEKIRITLTDGEDTSFLTKAEEVLKRFFQLGPEVRKKDAESVHSYYAICLQEDASRKLDIESKQKVWDYVNPTTIFVERNINSKYYLTISCQCAWEKTHGLQLVFRDGKKLTRVSGHDGQYE